MLIIKLIRYIIGYVTFEAVGGFPERFVNLCTKNRIPLWNMKNQNSCITADTTVSGYKSIRQSAHRSGCRTHIIKKHGLPFFLNKNRSRKGFVIGAAVAIIITVWLSGGIWNITVSGNKTIPEEDIREVFASLGVETGARKSKISASEVADEAEKIIEKLAWASVNIKGSSAEIVVQERTDAPEFPDTETPCNIVASEDGIITEIEAEIGKAAVEAGDAVLKGDLLISGVTENLDKSEKLNAARGSVYAEVTKSIITVSGGETLLTQSELRKRYIIYFFGLEIPLGLSVGEENYYSEKSFLSDGEIMLPAGVISEHSYKAETETELPREYRTVYSAKKFADEYKAVFESSQISSEKFSCEKNGESVAFSGEYCVIKEIGSAQEIFVEKN